MLRKMASKLVSVWLGNQFVTKQIGLSEVHVYVFSDLTYANLITTFLIVISANIGQSSSST